jgi:IclR family transcriptional regulator, acetate operon repressor
VEASRGTVIQSVARASTVLELVAGDVGRIRAKQIAERIDVPLPTACHLLNTLCQAGLLEKLPDRRYQLGSTVGLLAEAFSAQISAPEYLLAALREIADITGETAYLSAWRNNDAVLLSIIEGHQAVRVAGLHLGYSGLTHARASGKVLLAFRGPGALDSYLLRHTVDCNLHRLRAEIEQVRADGYAIDEEQFAEGVSCVAAPVGDGGMAIGISAPSHRFLERRSDLIDKVTAVASKAIGPGVRAAVA